MKRIVFNLKREWYDRIASGEKDIEYRRICDHWKARFPVTQDILHSIGDKIVLSPVRMIDEDWYAVFRLGYSRKHPDIVRRITMIDIGPCPYEGWDGK